MPQKLLYLWSCLKAHGWRETALSCTSSCINLMWSPRRQLKCLLKQYSSSPFLYSHCNLLSFPSLMSSTTPCPGTPAYFSCHQIHFKLFWRNQSTTTEAFKEDERTEQNLTAGRETWPRCFNWLSRTNTHSRNLSAFFFFFKGYKGSSACIF